MGKKQGVNQTFGLSCQGSAVLHAQVQKYEAAEKGQAGRKRDLCFIGKKAAREEEQKHCSRDAAHPEIPPKDLPLSCAFPATPSPFCSTANTALDFAVMSNLWFHLEQRGKQCFFSVICTAVN